MEHGLKVTPSPPPDTGKGWRGTILSPVRGCLVLLVVSGTSVHCSKLHWVPLITSSVPTSTWLLSRFLCIKIIDSSFKKFGHNEHPPTMSCFFCIFLLFVSGTQCRYLMSRPTISGHVPCTQTSLLRYFVQLISRSKVLLFSVSRKFVLAATEFQTSKCPKFRGLILQFILITRYLN